MCARGRRAAKRNHMSTIRTQGIIAVLVLAIGVAQIGRAQSSPAPGLAGEGSARKGGHEGIQVHGHWTIEVKNPDGIVASHTEFENSLVPAGSGQISGASTLGTLLSGQVTVAAWGIEIEGAG